MKHIRLFTILMPLLVLNACALRQSGNVSTPSPTPTSTPDPLAGWTLERKVAQLFLVRPETITGGPLLTAGAEAQARYDEIPVGGFIFFKENITDEKQTIELVKSLRALSSEPIWIAVDMEGGRVNRFPADAFPYMAPPALTLAQQNDPEAVRDLHRRMGQELLAWGFDVDFAPVADVFSNPENKVIGTRAFGTTPEDASPYVAAATLGLKEAGVLPVLKHFPGHGDTIGDTHKGAVQATKTLKEMERFEFLPFEAGFQAGADAVMVAHVLCPNVTDDGLPASLSHEIITDILRKRLGFDGLVFTDALDMEAVSKYYTPDKAAVKAIEAGADVLLMPTDTKAAFSAVLAAVKNGEITEKRIDQSVLRILKYKQGGK